MEEIGDLVVGHPSIGSHVSGDIQDRRGRFRREEKGKEDGGGFDEPEEIDFTGITNN